jgi:hypothetical protein
MLCGNVIGSYGHFADYPCSELAPLSPIQQVEDYFHHQIGLNFKEETSEVLHLEQL